MSNRTIEINAQDGVCLRAQVLGAADGPRLIMGHGNGLATRGYAAYWSLLANDYQLVLVDVRGHGASDCGELDHHHWAQFEEDFDQVLRAVDEALGRRTTYGVFHSLSAIVALRHARRFTSGLQGLLLFDPPVIPPDGHPLQQAHVDEMMALSNRVATRRAHFDSPKELADQFRRARAFGRWQSAAIDDMAAATLRQSPHPEAGRWSLSCPPAYEAKIFASNNDTTVWSSLSSLKTPLKLVCADPDVPDVQPSALTGREMAREFGLDYEFVEDTTHFLQVERPDLCAAVTRRFCR